MALGGSHQLLPESLNCEEVVIKVKGNFNKILNLVEQYNNSYNSSFTNFINFNNTNNNNSNSNQFNNFKFNMNTSNNNLSFASSY